MWLSTPKPHRNARASPLMKHLQTLREATIFVFSRSFHSFWTGHPLVTMFQHFLPILNFRTFLVARGPFGHWDRLGSALSGRTEARGDALR